MTVTQPVNGGSYTLGQSDNTTLASYACSAVRRHHGISSRAVSHGVKYAPPPTHRAAPLPAGRNSTPALSARIPSPRRYRIPQLTPASRSLVTRWWRPRPSRACRAATFAVGSPGSVLFSATGYPVPTFTKSGALPAGVTFVDNRNGTATLGGIRRSAASSPSPSRHRTGSVRRPSWPSRSRRPDPTHRGQVQRHLQRNLQRELDGVGRPDLHLRRWRSHRQRG